MYLSWSQQEEQYGHTQGQAYITPRVQMQLKPEAHQAAKELSRVLTEKTGRFVPMSTAILQALDKQLEELEPKPLRAK